MRCLSTAGASPPVSFTEALHRGVAPDGGLYLPDRLESLPAEFFEKLESPEPGRVGARVARHLLGSEINSPVVDKIVDSALDFSIPLVKLTERIWILELFHGPTLAFKDVGARFLARALERTREDQRQFTVLVATSGDTGGAVAQAFLGVAGARVAVLYPEGQVTSVQERQFATLGGNVRALAVDGNFDDCQRLVKQAFADEELRASLCLTSANSINIGRLLPQITYYFHALAQLGERRERVVFSTPSGNFGNLTAGLMAKRLGLDCQFVAATNANDIVPSYLETGLFEPRPSKRTLSNAMDVGNPSNFARIRTLYGDDLESLRRDVKGLRIEDEETLGTIQRVDQEHGYVLDPHTAVGLCALEKAFSSEPSTTTGIVLATAHPAKFREVVEPALGRSLPLPKQLADRLEDPVRNEELPNDFGALRRSLLAWP